MWFLVFFVGYIYEFVMKCVMLLLGRLRWNDISRNLFGWWFCMMMVFGILKFFGIIKFMENLRFIVVNGFSVVIYFLMIIFLVINVLLVFVIYSMNFSIVVIIML